MRYFGNTRGVNKVDGDIAVNGCGRFADIDATALAALKGLGVTDIWLTGCLRQATLTDYAAYGLPSDDPDLVKGVGGSPYAVRDYYDVSPDYAVDPATRMAEFEALVARVHAAGLSALIDLVPNHVARGYQSTFAGRDSVAMTDRYACRSRVRRRRRLRRDVAISSRCLRSGDARGVRTDPIDGSRFTASFVVLARYAPHRSQLRLDEQAIGE